MSRDRKPVHGKPHPPVITPPDDEPYKVGYGKPPTEHRLKPGQSGNRRGRPRRSHSTAAVFEAMFRSTVPMIVDGRRRRFTVRQAMALRAMKDILTGNPRAIERWLAYAEKVEPRVIEHDALQLDCDSLTEEQLRVLASIRIGK